MPINPNAIPTHKISSDMSKAELQSALAEALRIIEVFLASGQNDMVLADKDRNKRDAEHFVEQYRDD